MEEEAAESAPEEGGPEGARRTDIQRGSSRAGPTEDAHAGIAGGGGPGAPADLHGQGEDEAEEESPPGCRG